VGRNFTPQAIAQLTLGRGETLRADAGLILLKGLLQSGVAYLGGYPGAPTSTLYDAITDAYQPVLKDLGIYFDNSNNEAAAAAHFELGQHLQRYSGGERPVHEASHLFDRMIASFPARHFHVELADALLEGGGWITLTGSEPGNVSSSPSSNA